MQELNGILHQVLAAVLTAAATTVLPLAAGALVRWLLHALHAMQLGAVEEYVWLLVRAAHQIFDKPERVEKAKRWVEMQVVARFPWVPTHVLDAVIEAAVLEVKRQFPEYGAAEEVPS